ncbi:MAG: hypothetical protein R3B49_11680, partial [Phycisphaerales bacterium]
LALVIDRGVLAPASASASEMPAGGGVVDQLLSLAGAATADKQADNTPLLLPAAIAERLKLADGGSGELTDAFALPVSWTQVTPVSAPVKPEAQRQKLVLSAVMPSRTGGVAIINGTSVRVGDTVAGSGYRLVRVTEGTAVVAQGESEVELSLPQSTAMSQN